MKQFHEKLQENLNSIARFGNIRKAAKELETDISDVAQAAYDAHQHGLTPSIAALYEFDELQASRVVGKINKKWSRLEIIDEFKRLELLLGTVTRATFRDFSPVPLETVDYLFGNFSTAAGLALSKETAVHKALSKERIKEAKQEVLYDEWNIARRRYGVLYDVPPPRKQKEISFLIISDMHDFMTDPLVYRAFISEAATGDYHHIVLNGDILDCYEYSRFTKNQFFFKDDEIKWATQFFNDLRAAAPDSQIDFIEGNHEYRIVKFAAETPGFASMCRSMNFDVPQLLGIKPEHRINYVGQIDISIEDRLVWTKSFDSPNKKKYYRSFLVRHTPPKKGNVVMPGTNGHHHKFISTPHHNDEYGAFHWVQTGSGCIQKADYDQESPETWNPGFATAFVDIRREPGLVEMHWHGANEVLRVHGRKYTRLKNETRGHQSIAELTRKRKFA